MKKLSLLKKDKLLTQKKKYVFLSTIMLIGFISGIIFLFLLNKSDKTVLTTEMNNFFNNIKSNQLNSGSAIINSISSNLLYIGITWLLGISIIGIPFIVFLLFFKCFVFGFGIVSIIASYGFKGILLSFAYIFPHQLIYLLIWLLLSFYSLSFSIKLFKTLFMKKTINLRENFIRYTKILGVCIIASLICSLIEVYITPHFIKLFIF